MNADLLVIAPHPDDAELHAGATIARECRHGKHVVVIDCSRGEQASRGSPQQRAEEAAAAARCLGVAARENLGLADGGLAPHNPEHRHAMVHALRRYRPHTVLAMHDHARHPDHRACAELVRAAVKAAAIHGYQTDDLTAHRVQRLLFYEAELPLIGAQPILSLCEEADVTSKQAALSCYSSQWGVGNDKAPATSIAEPAFLNWIEQRGRSWGYHAGGAYAEALMPELPWKITRLFTD